MIFAGAPASAPTHEASELDVSEDNLGALLDREQAEALEAHDRRHSGPGGEPECPRCGAGMVRLVEEHRAPRGDESPFRVRLICSSRDCRAWTVYDW